MLQGETDRLATIFPHLSIPRHLRTLLYDEHKWQLCDKDPFSTSYDKNLDPKDYKAIMHHDPLFVDITVLVKTL